MVLEMYCTRVGKALPLVNPAHMELDLVDKICEETQKRGSAGVFRRRKLRLLRNPPLLRGTNPAMLSRKVGIVYGNNPYDLIRPVRLVEALASQV